MEMFEYKQDYLTKAMTIAQIFATFYYFMELLILCDVYSQWNVMLKNRRIHGYYELGVVPECMEDEATIKKWAGNSIEWLTIELFVFGIYLFTMLLFMLKSRCLSVGISQEIQFEPMMMSKLANKLCDNVTLDVMQMRRSKAYQRNKYCN